MNIIVMSLAALLTQIAAGTPIEFIHTGQGSGTLNGVAFGLSQFTIRAYGDTASRGSVNHNGSIGFFVPHTSASIEIEGLGLINFTVPTRTFVSNSSSSVGLSIDLAPRLDLLNGLRDNVFQSWDMLESIGPIQGTARLLQWNAVNPDTDRGHLIFQDQSVSVATFEGVVVPGPGALAIVGIGGLLALGRKRQRRQIAPM